MKYIQFLIIISLLISCDRADIKLKIVNKSTSDLYYVESYDDKIKGYPLVFDKKNKIDSLYSDILKVNEEYGLFVMNTKWEKEINEACKDSAIRIYFFKKELVENVPKDSFLKRQAYSKKFKLKVKDLEKMNWRVVYGGK